MTFARAVAAMPLLVSALLAGCGPKNSDAILNRVYECKANSTDSDCGTAKSGAALLCTNVAETLGGTDICAEACAEGPDVVASTYACLQDGSRAARCHPSLGDSACPDPALRCYRTDLEEDEGLCMPLSTCSTDNDCTDSARTACASSLAAQQYAVAAPGLKLDSLNCMAVGCSARHANCPSGEQCIQSIFPAMAGIPDVCLPSCVSNGKRCPPNYSCLQRLNPTYPNVCVPGLLGKPCDSDLDCMIGHCTDVEYGYKVCSRGCTTDADCIPFDNGPTYFFCANNQCISPESLLWPSCVTDADCPGPGLVCARPHPDDQTGACHFPCAADGSCPSRAGIIHGCHVWSGVPVCQPGVFGRYECTQDADCAPGLSCLPIDDRAPTGVKQCSIACLTDADCAANRQTTNGYCGRGMCHQPEASGTTCDRDTVCESGHCDTTAKACL